MATPDLLHDPHGILAFHACVAAGGMYAVRGRMVSPNPVMFIIMIEGRDLNEIAHRRTFGALRRARQEPVEGPHAVR